MDLLVLSSSAEAATGKTPGIYREELNCLASGRGLEGADFSQTEVLAEAITPLLTQPAGTGRLEVWVSINLANTLALVISRSCPNQLAGPPKPLPVAFPYKWPV